MKTILSLIGAALFCVCTISFTTQAQQLYTMTTTGGAYYGGAILSMNPDGTFQTEHSFQPPAGWYPMGSMVTASNGNCYGVCFEGGTYGSCTIFSWDPVLQVYNDVYDFDITNGDYPTSTPVEVGNGILYGTGIAGGLSGGGVIYAYDIINDAYTIAHNFTTNSTGSLPYPYGDLVLHSNGKLYGMTAYGGANGVGTFYSLEPGTNLFTELHQFYANGVLPFGGLVEKNGILYGMTSAGGTYNNGVIFSFNPSGNVLSAIYQFDGANGAAPVGTLIKGADGMLYGMTSSGGADSAGVLFQFNTVNNGFTALHHFDGTHGSMNMGNLGMPARGGLHELNGVLYGTAPSGGAHASGVIFSFDVAGNAYTVLIDLDATIHGAYPDGAFIPVPQPNGVLSAFISGTKEQCIDVSNSIPLTTHVRNGIGPFTFSWNTGHTTQSIDATQIYGVNHFSVTVTENGKGESVVSTFDISRGPASEVQVAVDHHTVTLDYDTTGIQYSIDYGDGSPVTTSLTHNYKERGSYTITLIANSPCGSKTVTHTVGINNVSITPVNNLTFDVFPNPAQGNITISGTLISSSLLQVSDLSGKVVYQEYLNEKGINNTTTADLSQLPPGVYILHLETDTGSGIRKLVIE